MLQSEFEILTGIYVTDDMYKFIEGAYMQLKLDKSVFCERYKNNKDGLAQVIQQEANRRKLLNDEEVLNENCRLHDKIKRLEAELDKEQEWEPYQISAMNAVDYEKLRRYDKPMSKEAAAEKIAEEFGFAKERIKVLDTIPIYKKNRHGQIKEVGTEERTPIYDASDYNYIRFDVCTRGSTFRYEMVNGELEMY